MLLKKIVVAEDDDAIAHMVNMALGDAGYLCLRATNGEEALTLTRVHSPDLLVLDVMMPRLDGIEVARTLKSDVILSRIPILMLTALGAVDNKIEGYEAGADAYMTKPFDLREFGARAKSLIRAAKRERDRNPTTNLPGSSAVEQHIDEVLSSRTPSSVLHFDLDLFDRYADHIGYSKTEELVASLGTVVLEKARDAGGGVAFVGHLGGADFVAVTAPDKAEALAKAAIDVFEERRGEWIETGAGVPVPSMAVAVVHTEGLGADDGDTLAERLATAMRAAKERDGSSHVVWSRDID